MDFNKQDYLLCMMKFFSSFLCCVSLTISYGYVCVHAFLKRTIRFYNITHWMCSVNNLGWVQILSYCLIHAWYYPYNIYRSCLLLFLIISHNLFLLFIKFIFYLHQFFFLNYLYHFWLLCSCFFTDWSKSCISETGTSKGE